MILYNYTLRTIQCLATHIKRARGLTLFLVVWNTVFGTYLLFVPPWLTAFYLYPSGGGPRDGNFIYIICFCLLVPFLFFPQFFGLCVTGDCPLSPLPFLPGSSALVSNLEPFALSGSVPVAYLFFTSSPFAYSSFCLESRKTMANIGICHWLLYFWIPLSRAINWNYQWRTCAYGSITWFSEVRSVHLFWSDLFYWAFTVGDLCVVNAHIPD